MVTWLYSPAVVLTSVGEDGVGDSGLEKLLLREQLPSECIGWIFRSCYQLGSIYSPAAEHGHPSVLCSLARQLNAITSVSIPVVEVGRVQSLHTQSHKRAKATAPNALREMLGSMAMGMMSLVP